MSVDWVTTPVYGTWWNDDGTLKAGTFDIRLISRVTNSDADGIFPAQRWKSGELVTTGTQSLSVLCPVSDDAANLPQGFKLSALITFADGSRPELYVFGLPSSLNGLTPPGLNLRSIQLPQDDVEQIGQLIGIPGGVARLDADGDVVDAAGNKVTGGGSSITDNGDGTWTSDGFTDNGDGTWTI